MCLCVYASACLHVCVCARARAQVTWLWPGLLRLSEVRQHRPHVRTRTHNGCIVSGRRAVAVVLLQGYIPELLMPPPPPRRRRRTRRARSLSTGMPHLARALVQSVGPIRKTSVVHPGAPLLHTKTHTHTLKSTHTHIRLALIRTDDDDATAAGKPVFDPYDSRALTAAAILVGALAAARPPQRSRACVCQAPPKPPPRPSPVAPCHRQITRLVCSPRYRTRPS